MIRIKLQFRLTRSLHLLRTHNILFTTTCFGLSRCVSLAGYIWAYLSQCRAPWGHSLIYIFLSTSSILTGSLKVLDLKHTRKYTHTELNYMLLIRILLDIWRHKTMKRSRVEYGKHTNTNQKETEVAIIIRQSGFQNKTYC